jgi:glutathione S-transferase
MALTLYGHLFSSYTQKVLIALYENNTAFEFRAIGPDVPAHTAEWLKHWPLGEERTGFASVVALLAQ